MRHETRGFVRNARHVAWNQAGSAKGRARAVHRLPSPRLATPTTSPGIHTVHESLLKHILRRKRAYADLPFFAFLLARQMHQQTGEELRYLGEFHFQRESGHAMNSEHAELAALTLDEATQADAMRRVDEVFELFADWIEELLGYALAQQPQGDWYPPGWQRDHPDNAGLHALWDLHQMMGRSRMALVMQALYRQTLPASGALPESARSTFLDHARPGTHERVQLPLSRSGL